MIVEQSETNGLINSIRVMDLRMEKKGDPLAKMKPTTPSFERKKMDNRRQSYSQGGPGRRMFRASYFSVKSLLVLICLTASLLILPLILPPLPPPPFMLLLVPIGILAVLMLLVFMPPANVRDITNAYM